MARARPDSIGAERTGSAPEVGASPDHPLGRTRLSAAWTAAGIAVALGICLIDFIAQNTTSVRIEFFAASGHVPLAVALLAAAVLGGLVVLLIGMGRTAQLRLRARREQRAVSQFGDDALGGTGGKAPPPLR